MEPFRLDPGSRRAVHFRREPTRRVEEIRNVMNRLLIVDDEPDYLEELVEALAFAGIASCNVSTGAAALAAVRTDPDIRCVLTDIRMPDMDGIALIEALRLAWPDRELAFVVMTGHAAEGDVARARAAGAACCFSKPLAFEALCDALVRLDAVPAQEH